MPDSIRSTDTWKHEQELWVENDRGGRVSILGADDPDTLRGEGWKGCIVDETADIDSYLYDAVIAPALSDHDGWIWFIGTPKGFNWFYEWFIRDINFHDPLYKNIDDQKIEPDPDVCSLRFTSLENPHISHDYIRKMRTKMSPEYFKQEYEADFSNFTGLVYREFMERRDELTLKAICEETTGAVTGARFPDGRMVKFKSWYFWYAGLDTGRTSAWLQVCVDDSGTEYITDEVYNVDGLVCDIAENIKAKMRGRTQRGGVIDSASQVKREYEAAGIYYQDSEKDVLTSIQIVRRKFRGNQLFVLDSCPATIRELSSRRWNEKKQHGKPEPIKKNDHAMNALDYLELNFLADFHNQEKRWKDKIISPDEKKIKEKSLFAITSKGNSDIDSIIENLA